MEDGGALQGSGVAKREMMSFGDEGSPGPTWSRALGRAQAWLGIYVRGTARWMGEGSPGGGCCEWGRGARVGAVMAEGGELGGVWGATGGVGAAWGARRRAGPGSRRGVQLCVGCRE